MRPEHFHSRVLMKWNHGLGYSIPTPQPLIRTAVKDHVPAPWTRVAQVESDPSDA